jgi:hypothetical protein
MGTSSSWVSTAKLAQAGGLYLGLIVQSGLENTFGRAAHERFARERYIRVSYGKVLRIFQLQDIGQLQLTDPYLIARCYQTLFIPGQLRFQLKQIALGRSPRFYQFFGSANLGQGVLHLLSRHGGYFLVEQNLEISTGYVEPYIVLGLLVIGQGSAIVQLGAADGVVKPPSLVKIPGGLRLQISRLAIGLAYFVGYGVDVKTKVPTVIKAAGDAGGVIPLGRLEVVFPLARLQLRSLNIQILLLGIGHTFLQGPDAIWRDGALLAGGQM